MKHKTSELEGALLDAAVAECGEWKTAHKLFPTMTLDPTFSGWRVVDHGDFVGCYLQPRNPMRQDQQLYNPSKDWAIGGPIIERERIDLLHWNSGWRAQVGASDEGFKFDSPTPLIAAMRAFVASKLGNEVDLP